MDPVGFTSRLTAAARARETERPDHLFSDEFAAALAGPEGFAFLETHWFALGGTPRPNFTVRTRFFDDFLLATARTHGVRQVVLVAAGLDTRAFRLEWPPGMHLFEMDQKEVLDYKASILGPLRATPRCRRTTVAVDLRTDWSRALIDAGYRAMEPTAWLLEGLLMYLPDAAVERVLAETARLSAQGSQLGVDTLPRGFLKMRGFIELYAQRGCPVAFTTDDPLGTLGRCGWRATAYSVPEEGVRLGRPWPLPLTPDTPRGALLTAERAAA
ncbi:MAG TPA: SAM-dependent methyltransferase [Myxococcota bacterium]|nr:SAM-dependent methyltransferase [Myxococcota bacterium]